MATAKKPAAKKPAAKKPAAKKPAAKKIEVKEGPVDVPAVNPPTTVALSTAEAEDGIGPFDHYREVATIHGVFGIPPFHIMTFEEFEKNNEIGHRPIFTDTRE